MPQDHSQVRDQGNLVAMPVAHTQVYSEPHPGHMPPAEPLTPGASQATTYQGTGPDGLARTVQLQTIQPRLDQSGIVPGDSLAARLQAFDERNATLASQPWIDRIEEPAHMPPVYPHRDGQQDTAHLQYASPPHQTRDGDTVYPPLDSPRESPYYGQPQLPVATSNPYASNPHHSADTMALPQGYETYPPMGESDGSLPARPQFPEMRPDAHAKEGTQDIGGDELLDMQLSHLSTFEDSVRSFASVRGRVKGILPDNEAQAPKPRKVVKRGPRKPVEPAGDVKMRLNHANTAYFGGRFDEALDFVNDAIRLNAEVPRAWNLLSMIHRDCGNPKESLLAAVCASQLEPKVIDGWLGCSALAVELMDELPDDVDDLTRIALSTFSQAIHIDPNHMVAREGKAALLLARESYRSATSQYAYIVERNNWDVYALRGFAEASRRLAENAKKTETEGIPEASINAYRRCIDHYQATGIDEEMPFEWKDVELYADLLIHLGHWDEALKEVKSIARWLLGRKDEAYWDDVDDDREWDEEDMRRAAIEGFSVAKYPVTAYGIGLPPQLRAKLAVCRIRLRHDDEAKIHMDYLYPADESAADIKSQQPEILFEVALALFETSKFETAIRFFEPLRDLDILDGTALYQAGKCYLFLGDKRQAEECFSEAMDSEESPIDSRISARYELAKMYEDAKQDAEAYILVNEAMNLEEDRDNAVAVGGTGNGDDERGKKAKAKHAGPLRKRKAENGGAESGRKRQRKLIATRVPKAPRIPRKPRGPYHRRRPRFFALDEERRKVEDERSAYMASKWDVVRTVPNKSEDGGPSSTWMEAARELLDDFRSFKAFYPWDRYLVHMGLQQDRSSISANNPTLLQMAERLRDNLDPSQPAQRAHVSVSYRDVVWRDWLDLFVEYALSTAREGKIKEAYDILDSAKDANVFFDNAEDTFLIHIAIAAVALRARDEQKCVEVCRHLMAKYHFATDVFLMHSAVCRLCASTSTWYTDTRAQKFILRQIKFMDSALLPAGLKDPKTLGHYDAKNYPHAEFHVPLLVLYGHILFISNSFTYALNYYLRAQSIDPDNVMINISVGLAYVHYALKRQAENRQHLLAQGLAFLHKYYEGKLRAAGEVAAGEVVGARSSASLQRQEAHFNMGRCYHLVGLTHLAAEYYRRVLDEEEVRSGGDAARGGGEAGGGESLAREAAYNLQQMCYVGGDLAAAGEFTRRWLVF